MPYFPPGPSVKSQGGIFAIDNLSGSPGDVLTKVDDNHADFQPGGGGGGGLAWAVASFTYGGSPTNSPWFDSGPSAPQRNDYPTDIQYKAADLGSLDSGGFIPQNSPDGLFVSAAGVMNITTGPTSDCYLHVEIRMTDGGSTQDLIFGPSIFIPAGYTGINLSWAVSGMFLYGFGTSSWIQPFLFFDDGSILADSFDGKMGMQIQV